MSVGIRVTHPGFTSTVRTFKNRREAAKYGVAYYLRDNGYATPREATTVASEYQNTGHAKHGVFIFAEIAA